LNIFDRDHYLIIQSIRNFVILQRVNVQLNAFICLHRNVYYEITLYITIRIAQSLSFTHK